MLDEEEKLGDDEESDPRPEQTAMVEILRTKYGSDAGNVNADVTFLLKEVDYWRAEAEKWRGRVGQLEEYWGNLRR